MNKIIICAALIITTIQQFTLANVGKQLSSNFTLESGVTYALNFTLNKNITAGSSLIITFAS
jgi:hypothetical protein